MKLNYFIRNFSRNEVVDGVRNIKRYYVPYHRIISDRNPLVNNGSKAIIKHGDRNYTYLINQSQITTFLAASSLSHVLDGWTYLSKAFNSLISGDEGTAIHLGYYAELRSAMSILAAEGLGVFNTQHIGVVSPAKNLQFPENTYKTSGKRIKNTSEKTHTFTWNAIEKWSSSAKPHNSILKIFKVSGKDFIELTEYFHPTTATSTLLSKQIIQKWLKDWCFDIKLYKSDRDLRNEASYRPQRIKGFSQQINFTSIITNLSKYWSVISPTAMENFSLLDRYLLRKLYNSLYLELGSSESRVDLIYNAFNQHGINDEFLINFLDYQHPYENEHIIFENAALKESTPLAILARATLLLRISIGLVSQLFEDGGINKHELNFIWNHFGVNCGLWDYPNIPNNFNNLWYEIEPSLEDLITDINSVGNMSLHSIKQRNLESLTHLSQVYRACLWGLDF